MIGAPGRQPAKGTGLSTQRGLTAATKLEDWVDYAIRSDCALYSLAQFDNLAQKTRLSRLVVQRQLARACLEVAFSRSSSIPDRTSQLRTRLGWPSPQAHAGSRSQSQLGGRQSGLKRTA